MAQSKSQRLANVYKLLPGLLPPLSSLTSSLLLSPSLTLLQRPWPLCCFSDMLDKPYLRTVAPSVSQNALCQVSGRPTQHSFKSLFRCHLHDEAYPDIFNTVMCPQPQHSQPLCLPFLFSFSIALVTLYYIM